MNREYYMKIGYRMRLHPSKAGRAYTYAKVLSEHIHEGNITLDEALLMISKSNDFKSTELRSYCSWMLGAMLENDFWYKIMPFTNSALCEN